MSSLSQLAAFVLGTFRVAPASHGSLGLRAVTIGEASQFPCYRVEISHPFFCDRALVFRKEKKKTRSLVVYKCNKIKMKQNQKFSPFPLSNKMPPKRGKKTKRSRKKKMRPIHCHTPQSPIAVTSMGALFGVVGYSFRSRSFSLPPTPVSRVPKSAKAVKSSASC